MKSPWEDPQFAELSLKHLDAKFLPGTRQEVDFLEAALGLTPPAKVLDLGCGAGRHAIELARRGYQVVGVDISSRLLEAARQRAAQAGVEITCLQGSVADLPSLLGDAAEAAFDAAISIGEAGLGALGGWQRDVAFLRAVRTALKPGRGLVLTTFNGLRRYRQWQPGDERFDFLRGVQKWETPPTWQGTPLRETVRLYIPAEARLLFEMAGFENVRIYGCQPGQFEGQPLQIDDIEMMVIGRTPRGEI